MPLERLYSAANGNRCRDSQSNFRWSLGSLVKEWREDGSKQAGGRKDTTRKPWGLTGTESLSREHAVTEPRSPAHL